MTAPAQNSERICVAKIATAHGVRGLVKLHVFVEELTILDKPLFKNEETNETISLILKNKTAKHWLAEIKGVSDRDAAENLRGTELYLSKSDLPKLDDGEFYLSDLVGFEAVENDTIIGKVIATHNFGAGDLLEIQPQGAESFYLPYSDETILEITDEHLKISIPEGLRENS
ncbi:MAG: ribosome maturation factor RimM [Pseudomonadota bacterium]